MATAILSKNLQFNIVVFLFYFFFQLKYDLGTRGHCYLIDNNLGKCSDLQQTKEVQDEYLNDLYRFQYEVCCYLYTVTIQIRTNNNCTYLHLTSSIIQVDKK